jgi:hypothetical protein
MNTRNLLSLAEAAQAAGNQEEAYQYFTRVLEEDPDNHVAWLGKAEAAGWSSGLSGDRFPELIAGVERALACAPETERDALMKRAASSISQIVVALHGASTEHTKEYLSLDDTWSEHVDRCYSMLNALGVANTLDPTNATVLSNAIKLAQELLQGVAYRDEYDTDDNGRPRLKVKHISAESKARVKQHFDDFVAKMKALNPAYEPPKISEASDVSLVGCLGGLVALAFFGFIIWALFVR